MAGTAGAKAADAKVRTMTTRGFRVAVVAAFVSVCAVPLFGVSDDAEAIIARHKAFMGWTYGDGTLKSLRETIAFVAPTPKPDASTAPAPKAGAKQPAYGPRRGRTDIIRRGLLFRSTELGYERPLEDDGFTGSLFWRANENGFTVSVRGPGAAMELTADVIEAEAFGDLPAALRPSTTFDGKKASVVRITPTQGVPADLYFDDDGALLGYTLAPDKTDEREIVHFVSYAEFQPHKRYVDAYRYGSSTRTYRVFNFQANASVSDADLHPPAPRATWTFGEPRTVPITIRRGSFFGGAVYVSATINGRLGNFIVDSGSAGILLYDRFARAAGVKDVGRTAVSGVNGESIAASLVEIATLAIGGNTLHDVIASRSPQVVIDGKEDTTTDGLIGFDVLANALVDVDLKSERLTILDPKENQPVIKPGAYAFPVDLSEFEAGVPVKLQDEVLPSVWLDTGNSFFVILPHAAQGTHSGTIVSRFPFFGVDGESQVEADCVRFNQIQVGPYRYEHALSCFAPNEAFGKSGGLIGFDFLKHFNWTFDYPHGQLVLTPNGL
jgi:predicted aspartyl protease